MHLKDLSIILLDIFLIIETFLSIFNRLLGDMTLTIGFILFIIISSVSIWRNVLLLFIAGSFIGFIMEYSGLKTGFPFGGYEYLLFNGYKFLGVPIPVIFSWGIYITIGYLVASYYTKRFRWIYASISLVILDLAIDPLMVSKGVWRWNIHTPIEWFGIPYTNFIGWFMVSSISILIYESINRFSQPKSQDILYITPYLLTYLPLMVMLNQRSVLAVTYSLIIAYIFIILSYLLCKRWYKG